MKTIKCDKCGKEINRHPLQQAHFPSITIYVNEGFRVREIDLCNGCEEDLYAWMKGTEDDKNKYADISDVHDACVDCLKDLPPAEPERKKGSWIEEDDGLVICPECGEEYNWIVYRANFCENCGADMRGEEE